MLHNLCNITYVTAQNSSGFSWISKISFLEFFGLNRSITSTFTRCLRSTSSRGGQFGFEWSFCRCRSNSKLRWHNIETVEIIFTIQTPQLVNSPTQESTSHFLLRGNNQLLNFGIDWSVMKGKMGMKNTANIPPTLIFQHSPRWTCLKAAADDV